MQLRHSSHVSISFFVFSNKSVYCVVYRPNFLFVHIWLIMRLLCYTVPAFIM